MASSLHLLWTAAQKAWENRTLAVTGTKPREGPARFKRRVDLSHWPTCSSPVASWSPPLSCADWARRVSGGCGCGLGLLVGCSCCSFPVANADAEASDLSLLLPLSCASLLLVFGHQSCFRNLRAFRDEKMLRLL